MGMCADTASACKDCRRYFDAQRNARKAKDPESQFRAAVEVGKSLGLNRSERRRAGLTRSRARKRGVT